MKQPPWIKSQSKDVAPRVKQEQPRSKEDELKRHFDNAGGVIDRHRMVARRILRGVDPSPHSSLKDKSQTFRDVPQYLRDDAIEKVRAELALRLKDPAKAEIYVKGALLLIEKGANLDEAHDFSRLSKSGRSGGI